MNYNTNYIIFTFLFILSNFCNLKAGSFFELKLPFQNSKINEIDAYQSKIIVVGVINENSSDVFISTIDTSTGNIKSRIFSTASREIEPRVIIESNKIYLEFMELVSSGDNPIEYTLDFDLNILTNKQVDVAQDCEIWGSNFGVLFNSYVGLLGGSNSDLFLFTSDKIGKSNTKIIRNDINQGFTFGYYCEFDFKGDLQIVANTYKNIFSYYLLKVNPQLNKIIYSFDVKSNFSNYAKRTHTFNEDNICVGNSLRINNDLIQIFNYNDLGVVKYNNIYSLNESNLNNYDLTVLGSCKDSENIYLSCVYNQKKTKVKKGIVIKVKSNDGSMVWAKISKDSNSEFKSINFYGNRLLVGNNSLNNKNLSESKVFEIGINGESCLLDSIYIQQTKEDLVLNKNNSYFIDLQLNILNQGVINAYSNLNIEKSICDISTQEPCAKFKLDKKDFNSGCGTDSVKLSIVPNLPNYTFNWNNSETTNSITARKTGKYKVYIQSIENINCLDSIEIDIEINNNSNSGGKLNKLIVENESYPFSLDTVYSNTIECRKIKITNISNIDVSLAEESFVINKQYSIPSSQFPLNIKSKDSINLLYCFNSNISGIYRDTLIINDECNPHKLKFVSYSVIPDKIGSNKCNSEFDISFNRKLIEKNIKFSNFFPNPVSDNLSINFEIDNSSSTESLDFEYTIYNVIGIELVKDNISYNSIDNNLQTITIPFLDLSKGNYFVKVKHFSSIKSFWVIKE